MGNFEKMKKKAIEKSIMLEMNNLEPFPFEPAKREELLDLVKTIELNGADNTFYLLKDDILKEVDYNSNKLKDFLIDNATEFNIDEEDIFELKNEDLSNDEVKGFFISKLSKLDLKKDFKNKTEEYIGFEIMDNKINIAFAPHLKDKMEEIKTDFFRDVATKDFVPLINENLEKIIDEKFQLRVDNLKNKEEFLIKNAEEFNLTLTEDNRISELNSDDENEYKGNIEDFIKGYKENIKSDFFDKIEEKKEEFLLNKEKIFGNYVRDEEDIKSAYNQAILDLSYKHHHNHFYDYQEKIMQNQISLSIDEKDIKENYYDGNKYVSKILEDSKDLSETISFDEKTFYKELRKFDTSPYEKFSDDKIEITKEKEEIKEKSKNKEKEMEL